MASSANVANRFLDLAEEHNNPLTPMQLLKLVYIAHGWMLGLYSRPLINEQVEAWQYGPVIRSLYSHLREYRGAPVTRKISTMFSRGSLDDDEKSVIDQVYRAYSKFSGMELSRITHAKGSPWDRTYVPGSFGTIIPVDLIEDHYKRLAEQQSV